MSIYILGPDQDGNCCTCAERVNVCDTCVPTVCLECQTKGGSIPYCGPFDGFLDDTTHYRTISLAGTLTACLYDSSDHTCIGAINGGAQQTYAGSCSWIGHCTAGVLSCDPVSVGTVLTQRPTVGCSVWDAGTSSPACGLAVGAIPTATLVATTDSNTSQSFTGNEVCTSIFLGGNWITVGTMTMTLSDLETRDEAITRLLSCVDWADGSCGNVSTSNVYELGRWRINKSGLLPSTTYDFTVTYWRKVAGGPTWTLYQTLHLEDTSDVSGNLITSYTDTPIADGYETEVRCDCVFTPA